MQCGYLAALRSSDYDCPRGITAHYLRIFSFFLSFFFLPVNSDLHLANHSVNYTAPDWNQMGNVYNSVFYSIWGFCVGQGVFCFVFLLLFVCLFVLCCNKQIICLDFEVLTRA